ncbi:MAG: T9SS type A sorting domain-containing protein [Hymenobacter sp.]
MRLPGGFGPATVQVLDVRGAQVLQAALPTGGGIVRVGALPPGLYLLRAVGASGNLVQRIVRE